MPEGVSAFFFFFEELLLFSLAAPHRVSLILLHHIVLGGHAERILVAVDERCPTAIKCGVRFISWLLAFDQGALSAKVFGPYFCHLSTLF